MLRISWRNIWRNKRRSLLTIVAIAFVAAILVFFNCLQFSTYNTAIEATTSLFQGHMHIENDGYYERPQMRNAVENPDQILKQISDVQGIKAIAERSFGFALVSSASRSYGIQIMGVNYSQEQELSSIPGQVEKGQYLDDSSDYHAVLGEILATNLQVSVGDELTILGQGKDGSLVATVLKVQGIFRSGIATIDRAFIQIPLDTFDIEFQMFKDIHQLAIRLDHLDDLERVQEALKLRLKNFDEDLVVLRWDEFLPGLKQSIELDFASSWLFFFSLIIVVCFTVMNTILMSVLERTKEFGIMMALGATPTRIAGMVAIEFVFLSFMGLFLGIAIGALITGYFGFHGFYIPGTEQVMSQWNLSGKLYPKLSLMSVTFGPGIIFVTALLGLIYPILKVRRMEAITAMGMH